MVNDYFLVSSFFFSLAVLSVFFALTWHLFSPIVFCYTWHYVFSKAKVDDPLNRAICAWAPEGFDDGIKEIFLIVTLWLWRLLHLGFTKAWGSSRSNKSTSHLGWLFNGGEFCWGIWVLMEVVPSFLYILFCCVLHAFKIFLKLSRTHRLEWNTNIPKQQKRLLPIKEHRFSVPIHSVWGRKKANWIGCFSQYSWEAFACLI